MEKKTENFKEKLETKALLVLRKFGDLSLNNCCMLALYEPTVPEELMDDSDK